MNKTKTLHQSLTAAVRNAAVAFALFGSTLVFVAVQDSPRAAERPLAIGSPAQLVAEHGCWLGEAPEDAEAGSVVVTMEGAVAPVFTTDPEVVGDALDKVFGGKAHGIWKVHGFCR